jgi:Predicted transcriptional regulator
MSNITSEDAFKIGAINCYHIYKLLNNEVLLASLLADEFQVSPRTIYRDMDVLGAAGFRSYPIKGRPKADML